MSEPMTCLRCGAVMNHHADKITYVGDREELNEFHHCPHCGKSASRKTDMDLPED
jgi:uncharacterized C2H2 Zn-finger protein